MFKKLLFGVIVMCCCFGMNYSNSSAAANLKADGCTYEFNSDGHTLQLVSCEGNSLETDYHVKSEVTIDGVTYRVTKVSSFLSFPNSKVIFDEGISEIAPFMSITAKEVSLPASFATLNRFWLSKGIGASMPPIHISPENPKYYSENNNFYTKDKKKLIMSYAKGKTVIPEGVEEIGSNAFSYTYVTQVDLPNSLKKIDNYAFSSCSDLKTVNMKDNVTTMGTRVFGYCSALENLTLSNGLRKIEKIAFRETKIKSIKLGQYIKNPIDIISEMKHLTKVSLDSKNPYYKCVDNIFYSPDGKKLISGIKARGTVRIPKKVTTIKKNAFCENETVKKVVFQGTKIKKLPENCFAESSIQSVVLPKSLKELGVTCLRDCRNLKSIKLPKSLKYIREGAFQECGFEKLTIPKNVKRIDEDALWCTIGELVFRGTNPPIIKKQTKYVWEEKEVVDQGECEKPEEPEPFPYPDLTPGIDTVTAPKKAKAKYKKCLRKKMVYDCIQWK